MMMSWNNINEGWNELALARVKAPGEDGQKYGGLTSVTLIKIMILTVNPGS